MIGGGSAFWVLVYGLYYWASRLQLDSFAAAVLYLGYLILIALLDFLVTGKHQSVIAVFWLTNAKVQLASLPHTGLSEDYIVLYASIRVC